MGINAIWLNKVQERTISAVKCPKCHGYAEKVECTKDEVKSQTCGRSWACCVAAFVCKKCKQRIIAALEAPEME